MYQTKHKGHRYSNEGKERDKGFANVAKVKHKGKFSYIRAPKPDPSILSHFSPSSTVYHCETLVKKVCLRRRQMVMGIVSRCKNALM